MTFTLNETKVFSNRIGNDPAAAARRTFLATFTTVTTSPIILANVLLEMYSKSASSGMTGRSARIVISSTPFTEHRIRNKPGCIRGYA